jgi:hypothetical protein
MFLKKTLKKKDREKGKGGIGEKGKGERGRKWF